MSDPMRGESNESKGGPLTHSRADYAPTTPPGATGTIVAHVEPGSPADEAGVLPGMRVLSADGEPLRDIIDWFWLADGFSVELEVTDGILHGTTEMVREPMESWGLEFADNLFDGLRTCCNACTFCFMAMLPEGMRSGMYVRDDDYRLSFLQGNFVTLTNMTDDDVQRVIEQDLSPLHMSLHAVDADARRQLMGRNHARGLEVACELLDAGIRLHLQVVLVPGVNDGAVLDETIRWAIAEDNVESIGIVPLGYTRFQDRFDTSFAEPAAARAVIEQVGAYQRELADAGWVGKVQLADEFYVNAYGADAIAHLPAADDYAGYPQYFDGIGMLRVLVDEWGELDFGTLPGGTSQNALIVCGRSLEPVLHELVAASPLADRAEVLGVDNRFFGGNVDVSGLLTGADVAEALAERVARIGEGGVRAILPSAMFNDDGLTLDGMSVSGIESASGVPITVVCYTAKELMDAVLGASMRSDRVEG
ncbi:MAG: DUF512 domain-containing protein [Coriobacteriales bacterium]|jgi:putative radical SAM enzyme (TIGR03279 family)